MVKVHYGKLTLKIYTKGECVLRIEAIIHNTKEWPHSRPLKSFPWVAERMHGMVDQFLEALHAIDACFIADDTLEQLPEPGLVGQTKVGGIDCNKLRIRTVMHAVVALSTAAQGFTASDLAAKVRTFNGPSTQPYQPRQAAYDLKKLRGKKLVSRTGNSRRYEVTPHGLKTMATLALLRDKVLKPLLAASCHPMLSSERDKSVPLDQHYENVRCGMRGIFDALGIAA